MKWHDVSIPLQEGMTRWPGDPEFKFTANSRVAEGASCNTSTITLSSHAGTHCDAPWHFDDTGKKLDGVDTDLFMGPVTVMHFPDVDHIRAEDLPDGPLPERIFFKTRNADLPAHAPFQENFVALENCGAEKLVAAGVKLVGIDYLSIAPFGNSGPTHHTLLDNEVFIVEGLQLQTITPGEHQAIIMPMNIIGADGAPCRVFIQQ